jgi:5-methylcytosine-specific restriction enzyme subunit McrC
MRRTRKSISVFEHDRLKAQGDNIPLVEALSLHHGSGDRVSYYGLGHKMICFNQFVGVLQVGSHTIQVLPKVDGVHEGDQESWSQILIQMLHTVYGLEIRNTELAQLGYHQGTILDVYIEIFVRETETILRQGLVKSYRTTEGNRATLKGKLMFAQQIKYNLVHAEQFYVQHTTYDRDNLFNRILHTTLMLIQTISRNTAISGRIARLLLDFPELFSVKATEELFDRLKWNRKTERYRKAINLAKMLLLNYYPDVVLGRKDVMALMFDMNKLWERYVFEMLRRNTPEGWEVKCKRRKALWKPDSGKQKTLEPDIVAFQRATNRIVILDTKWKVPRPLSPSDQDIRQLFAYCQVWGAEKGYLLYPAAEDQHLNGVFQDDGHGLAGLMAFCLVEKGGLRKDIWGEVWGTISKHSANSE